MALRRWLARRGIHTHTVCDDDHGRIWRYGRIYAHVYDGFHEDARERFSLSASWCLRLRNAASVQIDVGGGDSDRELMLQGELFGASVYLTYDALPRWLCKRILPGHDYEYNGQTYRLTESTRTGLAWHDGILWWHGWETDTWRSTDPWWRRWTFHPVDFLLGRADFTRETLKTEHVVIPLSDKSYPATVTLQRGTRKRRRWFADHMWLANIEVENPPTFPGKGESSWDLDDDAILSMSCSARTVAEAVGHYITAVLRERERRGGRFDWQPEAVR